MRSIWLARSRPVIWGTLALLVSASLVASFAGARTVAAHGPGRLIASPGMSWRLVASPNASGNNYLYGLAAVSSSDLWAVGCSSCDDIGRSGVTLIEQWNGTAWNIVTSPNPGNAADLLRAAAADSATDVWAVGYQIVVGVGTDETLVEHYDGNSWQSVSDAPPSGISLLQGVAARSASDVWAVGLSEQPGYGSSSTFIEHYDGAKWTQSASSSPGYTNALNGVAALSASDVWAVGSEGNGSTQAPLVEHFDGSTWSAMSLPVSLTSLDGAFRSVVALATNNVWAVGYDIDPSSGAYTHTLVAHWNGATWSQVPSPNPGTDSALFGIAAVSSFSIWATGSEYGGGSTPAGPLTEYWNGCQWTVEPATSANSIANTLRAVAAVPMQNTAWAVGDYAAGATGALEQTLTETVTGQTTLARMAPARKTLAQPNIIQCM